MFGFLGTLLEPPERRKMREGFEKATHALHGADFMMQLAVGRTLNLANHQFLQRFGSVEAFQLRSRSEKLAYLQSLNQDETKMSTPDVHTSLAFGLFKIWVGALIANDAPLVAQFAEELAHFSRQGGLPLGPSR